MQQQALNALRGGRLSSSELADICGIPRKQVSGMLGGMVDEGKVVRLERAPGSKCRYLYDLPRVPNPNKTPLTYRHQLAREALRK